MPLLNSLILLLLNTSHLSAKSSTITATNTLLLLTSTMVSITIVSASPNLNLAFYILANTRFSSSIILKFWPAESTTIPAWTRSVLIVIALATKPSTAWYQFCAVFAKRVILVWIAILPVGSSNRWMEDVTVDSAEDDESDCSYGHNKEYLPLVPVLLAASRTISKIFAPPDVSPAASVLPSCFNNSPSSSPAVSLADSPILNSNGLLNPVESLPDPPHHPIPTLIHSGYLFQTFHLGNFVVMYIMITTLLFEFNIFHRNC